MIWWLSAGLVIAISAYLCAPLLARDMTVADDSEIEAYREELRALESQIKDGPLDEADRAQRAILQARLLKAAKSQAPDARAVSFLIPALLTLTLFGGTFGIYAMIGSPNFTPEVRQAPPPLPAQIPEQASFEELLPRLEARLAETPEDPTGWYLYGRTLMLVDRYEDGLRAYETSLELNDNPDVRQEYIAAQTYARQRQNGPSAEDIAAAENMSPEDRQEMILGMVSSLRARLDDTPEDAAGWRQLLRARKVLDQKEEAEADIKVLRQALPEQAEAIITETGWAT